jgi:3-deoxy-D-manno-octulosonate 8-phosphate phosphatase (KDO 8-P phosphatase)
MSTCKILAEDAKLRSTKIKLLLMDVDGVLTDGKLYYLPGPDGQTVETKGFNSQDGVGLHIWHKLEFVSGVISGRESQATVERAKNLKIRYVYQGLLEKENAYKEILADAGLTPESVAFIGDDFPDVPLMVQSGLAIAVNNARPELHDIAHLITSRTGGEGAVREAIEFILQSKGVWQSVLERFCLTNNMMSSK